MKLQTRCWLWRMKEFAVNMVYLAAGVAVGTGIAYALTHVVLP
jgi:hypothetical protein